MGKEADGELPGFEHFWDPDNEHDLQAMVAEANEE